MTEKEFVHICAGEAPKKPKEEKIPAGLNESKDKTDGKVGNVPVTHPVDGSKKHPKIGCAWDAMGPFAGSGESGPFDGITDGEGAQIGEGTPASAPAGDGGGAGGGMGESISPKEFRAILEGIAEKYPESQVVGQIRKMFDDLQDGGTGKMYCGADGCQAEEPDTSMVSDQEAAISAAAATVEAALMTFRKIAGYDYKFN